MNNEPVAWMCIETDDEGQFRSYRDKEPVWSEGYIPLYTHPVKELKLTKSEIEVLWEKHCPFDLTGGLAFARAILRKAQEK